jgi:hypothetical protein
VNSSSSASRQEDAGLVDDAPDVPPLTRRARRLAERSAGTTNSSVPDLRVNGGNGSARGKTGVNGVSGIARLSAVPSLDDETATGDDPGGPPPRPAPRYTRKRSVNGAFDDRTGLFEGPPGAEVTGEPPAPGRAPSLTPPDGALSGQEFGSSAFRARPEPDRPRPAPPPPPGRDAAEPHHPTHADTEAAGPLTRRRDAGGERSAGRLPSSGGSAATQARLALLAVVPPLTAVLAAWLVVTALLRLFSHAFSSLFLLIIGGGVLYGLVVAANRVLTTRPAPLLGADLPPDQHPRIWATTSELAERVGVPPPTRIVVDGGTTVLAREHELVIGLPLLIGLDDTELRTLVARELIDERSPDDVNGYLHRLGPRLERALGTLRTGAARWILTAYLALYRAVAAPENERHDQWCDEQAGGPLDAARRRISTTSTAWQIMLDEYLPLSSLAGRRPSLADAVGQILAARLTGPGERRGPSATSLLDGGPEAVHALEGSILVDDDPRAGWTEIVAVAARAQAELTAARLARAALTTVFSDRPADQPVSLAELLDALRRGRGPAMTEPLLRPAIPAAERAAEARTVLAQHLGAFVTLVMLREGLARHVLSWTGAPTQERLERVGDDLGAWVAWDLDDYVTAAAAGDADTLRARLTALGADLGRAVQPAPVPPLRVLSAFTDVELCGPFEARRIDLLIYDHGLLLAPAPADTLRRTLEKQVGRLPLPGSVSPAERVVRLAEQLGPAPGSLPGGWWIEQADISMGQLRERRTGMELQLRLADGAGATIRATPITSQRGTPVDDLGRMIPNLSE